MNCRWYCVGWVQKAHSLRGEVHIRLFAGQADWLSGTDHLALREGRGEEGQIWEGPLRPRTFKSVRLVPGGLLVHLTGVEDRTAAEVLQGNSVYIPESYLLSEDEEPFLYRFLQAQVVDEAGVNQGSVCAIGSNGFQDLLVVEKDGKRFEIPLIFPLVKEVDWSNHRLVVDLPPGLIEINQ